MIIKKMKSMYRAGRSGQPMPARADRSVGEVALNTGAFVVVFSASVFAMGVASRFLSPLTKTADDREIERLNGEIRKRDLKAQLDS